MKKLKEAYSKSKIYSNNHLENIQELVKISKYYGNIQTNLRDSNAKSCTKISNLYR